MSEQKYEKGKEVYYCYLVGIGQVNTYDGKVVSYCDGVYEIDYGRGCVDVKEEFVSDDYKEIQKIALDYLDKFQKERREALALKLGEHLLSIFEIYKNQIDKETLI